MNDILEMVEKEIEGYKEMGLNKENIHTLYELVDIRKDLKEGQKMRYNEDEYYGRRRRDSRGRYMDGRRHPHEMIDRMYEGYNGYEEGREEYRRSGNYGAKSEGMESLEYMLESFVQFYEHLMENAENPEEVELIKKYVRKIKEM